MAIYILRYVCDGTFGLVSLVSFVSFVSLVIGMLGLTEMIWHAFKYDQKR
jgi:hypothetical protein